jgi:hypothetical protein
MKSKPHCSDIYFQRFSENIGYTFLKTRTYKGKSTQQVLRTAIFVETGCYGNQSRVVATSKSEMSRFKL